MRWLPRVSPFLFIVLSPLLLTFPLVRDLGDGFVATPFVGQMKHSGLIPGDHLNNVYRFWLTADGLRHGELRLEDPYAFALQGGAEDPPLGWIFAPLYALGDAIFTPAVTYNLLLILSLVLSGLFVYLWLSRLQLPVAAATVGAVALIVYPITYDRLNGHIKAAFFWLMPAALWAAERARQSEGRKALAWGALSGVSVAGLLSVIEPETGVYFWPVLIAYCIGRMTRQVYWGLGAGLVLSLLYMFWFYSDVVSPSIMSAGRPYEAVLTFSPTIGDLFSRSYPPPGSERYIYPGIGALLAIYGAVRLCRSDLAIGVKLAMGLAPFIIVGSLGPKAPGIGVLYREAFERIPPFRVVQTPSRLMFVLGPLIALGVGFAFAKLGKGWVPWAIAVPLAALMILDAREVRFAISRPLPPSLYAGIEDVRAVLDVPITHPLNFLSSSYNYETTLLPAPRVGGVSPMAPQGADFFYESLSPINSGILDEGVMETVCGLGVSHVIVWEDIFGYPFDVPPHAAPVLNAFISDPRFSLIRSGSGIHIFSLDCAAP